MSRTDADQALLEATAFAHEAICGSHKLDDGFTEFMEHDEEGAYGVVYHRGAWYDAHTYVSLTPYEVETRGGDQ
jgi:hypothetical protein